MKNRNAQGEPAMIQARELRNLGIVDVDEPGEVVRAFSEGLRGEVDLGGADAGWVLIGGLPFGGTAIIKAADGQSLFKLTLERIPGAPLDDEPGANYAVLLKRTADGGVERLSINFADGSAMGYSNLAQQTLSAEQMSAAMTLAIKSGFMKQK
jgi:hypothetical protein